MVLQDGCWQKRNYERNESLLDSTADSNDILESHCVHHSSSVGKHYSAMSPQTQKKMVHGKGRNSRSNMDFYVSARNLEQHPDCYSYKQNLGGSAAGKLNFNLLESFSSLSMFSKSYLSYAPSRNTCFQPRYIFLRNKGKFCPFIISFEPLSSAQWSP